MMTLKQFCLERLDRMYDTRLSEDDQCTGYHLLKKMIVEKIEPASKEEVVRWETDPTLDELLSEPHIKYLRFLHPLTRPHIIDNWFWIKDLVID